MKITFIITAGGMGKRMGGNIPKQFIELIGQPILFHTIEKLFSFAPQSQFIITIPSNWISYWNSLVEKHEFNVKVQLVEGGKERFHSIQNALRFASGDVIAIHDGVRPFVSNKTLQKLFEQIENNQAVIPVMDIKESLRILTPEGSKILDRNSIKLVQTPQVFKSTVILEAYKLPFSPEFTDDASVVENAGYHVHLVSGNQENIKITTPEDLELAKLLLSLSNQKK